MEIAFEPERSSTADRRRLLLGLLLLLPVALLVLLPAVLGLERYVVTDDAMDGEINRGSVILARDVPTSDLGVGDVITFRSPAAGVDTMVTRRIVALDGIAAKTKGDANARRDPWTLRLTEDTYPRVSLGVPWVGRPFLEGSWVLLAMVAIVTLFLGAGRPWRRTDRSWVTQPATGGKHARTA